MSSIPLPALAVKPPEQQSILQQYGQVMSLRDLMQQSQMRKQQIEAGSQENQIRALELRDQQVLRSAFTDPSIDFTKPEALNQVVQSAAQKGVSPQTLFKLQNAHLEYQKNLASKNEVEIKNDIARNDQLRGRLTAIVQTQDPALKQSLWEKELASEEQAGTIQPGQISKQYPGDETATVFANHFALGSALAKEQTEKTTANARKQQADTSALMAPSTIARNTAEAALATTQNQNFGQVTPKDRFTQQQENYRATLARQATQANELQRQGIASLQKQSDSYTQFLGTANSLKQSLASAQDGNQMAAAVAPLQGTLFITTSEGVKRINETELRGVAGAGSLAQKIEGQLGNLEGGGPLSPQLKQDMAKLVDLYTQAKYGAYKKQAEYTQKLHGLNSATTPILGQDGSIAGPQNAQTGNVANGYVRIQASDGSVHDIPSANLGKARQRDPNLQLVQQ